MTRLRVGLTGGIACGKSMVGRMFYDLGAYLLNTDRVAHELIENHPGVRDRIISEFGSGILAEDQSIDRKKLANAAFADGRIRVLNGILHPLVITQTISWMEALPNNSTAMVEAALIFESGMHHQFDKIVTVTCNPWAKIERFAGRQKVSVEEAAAEVTRRTATQWPDEEKKRLADFVIDNSGGIYDTEKQVEEVWHQLQDLL